MINKMEVTKNYPPQPINKIKFKVIYHTLEITN